MRAIIIFLFILFMYDSTFGQKVDLVNAPINPIALQYKKEHFNLHGDIYGYGEKVFSKDGMLIYEYGISRGLHYLYKDGFPYADTEGKLYEFNNQGYLVKKTFASLGVQSQTYTYNTQGLISSEVSTKGNNAAYEYDDKGRLIKSNVGGSLREFSYQKNGEQLIVTIKDLSKNPVKIVKSIYKNGVKIGENDQLYNLKYDKSGNISGYDNAIYYRDIENRDNEISVIYTKSNFVIDPLSNCNFYINGQRVNFLFAQVPSITSKDIIIYNPFNEKYYFIKNALDDTKSGQKQVFSTVFLNGPYYLLNRKGSSLSLGYKGAVLGNTANGMRDGFLKVYNAPVYLVYDKLLKQTFSGDLTSLNNYGYYPLQQVSPQDNVVYLKTGVNQYVVVIDGEINAQKNPQNKMVSSTDGGSVITDDKNNPLYYLPGTNTATLNKLYAGRKYNAAKDKVIVPASSSSTTASSSSTSQQTVETRYYNGRYDFDNGLSSREVVLHKINSYITLLSKNATFLKLAEKPDFISGTWTIKSSPENILVAIDYLIGDKSFTAKLKYVTLGSTVVYKNHPQAEVRNLYNTVVDNFITKLFVYLEIKNNTTAKQPDIVNSSVKVPEKVTPVDPTVANFNASAPLYVRKLADKTLQFYQFGKRINPPLKYEIIYSMDGSREDIYCSYGLGKYYHYSFSANEMSPDKQYALKEKPQANYVYAYGNGSENDGISTLNFNGKVLQKSEYELWSTTGYYYVVRIKADNSTYIFDKKALQKYNKAICSKIAFAKGLLIYLKNNSVLFFEFNRPTDYNAWKVKTVNGAVVLFNEKENRKYQMRSSENNERFKSGVSFIYE